TPEPLLNLSPEPLSASSTVCRSHCSTTTSF
uniref:Uncharacterized protein LOC104243890 n=1 Tax=Nicotiana sylvestris TaxID=4096 RepID=A0A1U7XZR7_NICSY